MSSRENGGFFSSQPEWERKRPEPGEPFRRQCAQCATLGYAGCSREEAASPHIGRHWEARLRNLAASNKAEEAPTLAQQFFPDARERTPKA